MKKKIFNKILLGSLLSTILLDKRERKIRRNEREINEKYMKKIPFNIYKTWWIMPRRFVLNFEWLIYGFLKFYEHQTPNIIFRWMHGII